MDGSNGPGPIQHLLPLCVATLPELCFYTPSFILKGCLVWLGYNTPISFSLPLSQAFLWVVHLKSFFSGQKGAVWKFAKVGESHSDLSRYTSEPQTETPVALGTGRLKFQWLNKRQCQWISWQANVRKCSQMLCQKNWFGNNLIDPKAWHPAPVLLLDIS